MEQNKRVSTPFDDLTYKIIGCAMVVHRQLGPAHRENVYQRDLASHLTEAHLSFITQKLYEVFDFQNEGWLLGYYIPDFVVEDKIVVEIKALKGLDSSHLAQVIGYLGVSGCPIGLLINFRERSLKFRRILPPKKIKEDLINRQWLFVPDWLREDN